MLNNQYTKNWVLIPQALSGKNSLPDELKFLEEWHDLPALGKPAKDLFDFGNLIYLNHGAFGVVPLNILQKMDRLEKIRNVNPFKFQNSYLPLLLSYGMAMLSSFVKSDPTLTFFCESVCNGRMLATSTSPNRFAGVYNCLMSIAQQKSCPRVAYVKGSYVGLSSTLESLAAKKIIELIPFESQPPLDSSKLCAFIQSNNIGVVVLEHVANTTGSLNDVKNIVLQTKALGVVSIIDGAHAPGNIDLDIEGINSDFYVGSCYKWLFSLQGCSFVCVNKDWQNKFSPPFDTFMKLNQLIPFYWRGGINYMPYISCICGISLLHKYGFPQIQEHIKDVKNSIETILTKHWGAEVISAKELAFTVLRISANLKKNLNLGVCALEMTSLIAEQLSSQISIVIPSSSEVLARISLSLYSTAEDVNEIKNSILDIIKQFEDC